MAKIARARSKNKGISTLVRSAQRAQKSELAAQWRALQRLGALPTKTPARAAAVTPQRAAAIRKAYGEFQAHAIYRDGYVIRPLERRVTRSGRARYVLGDLFQAVPGKPRAPAGSIRTRTRTIVAREAGTTLRVRDNKVIATRKIGKEKSIIMENQPLLGIDEYMELLHDIESGTLKLKKNENIRIYNNGSATHFKTFGAHELEKLAAMLRAYLSGGVRNFDDWARNSELVTIRISTRPRVTSAERAPAQKTKTKSKAKSKAVRNTRALEKPKPKAKPKAKAKAEAKAKANAKAKRKARRS